MTAVLASLLKCERCNVTETLDCELEIFLGVGRAQSSELSSVVECEVPGVSLFILDTTFPAQLSATSDLRPET